MLNCGVLLKIDVFSRRRDPKRIEKLLVIGLQDLMVLDNENMMYSK